MYWIYWANDTATRIITWNVTGDERGVVELVTGWFG